MAQEVADALVTAGVSSVLNFAPRVLTVPPDVQLRYVDLSIELQVMSFYQSRRAEEVAAGGAVLRAVGLTPNPGRRWWFVGGERLPFDVKRRPPIRCPSSS